MYNSNKENGVRPTEIHNTQQVLKQLWNKMNKCHTQVAFLLMVDTFSLLFIEM